MSTIKNRKHKLFDFMEQVKLEEKEKNERKAMMESKSYKMKILNDNKIQYLNECVEYVLSDIYKKSLPLDNDYIICNEFTLEEDIKKLMTNKGGAFAYLSEAADKSKSMALNMIKNKCEKMCINKSADKLSNIENISVDNLDVRVNQDDKNKLDELSADIEFDDLSNIIKNNVENIIMDEINKAKEDEDEKQELQNTLMNDEDIRTDEDINNVTKESTRPSIFKPSLFEAIMMKNTKIYSEATNSYEPTDEIMMESVRELTQYSILNALRLENYTPQTISALAENLAEN